MLKLKFLIFIPAIVVFAVFISSWNYNKAGFSESKKIELAALDYIEGVYEADTSRIYRSVHSSLAKRGFWFNPNKGVYTPIQEMNFQQLVDLTKNWNKNGNRANNHSVREVLIYDIQDRTASAKVIAEWGTDYLHLAKDDGKWYIFNVLWQSHPRR